MIAVTAIAALFALAPVRVGSKQFTESVVLGEVLTQALRAAGLRAEHRRELGGTRVLFEALVAGQIDLYVEYSGTLREELLPAVVAGPNGASVAGPNGASVAGPNGAFSDARVAEALRGRGVELGPALGFDDTYALGMRRGESERLGVRTVSALAARPGARLGLSNEFMQRKDGWPRLQAVYGFSLAQARGMEHALAYRGLQAGELDATDLYSTDAEIRAGDLVALDDDRHAFPAYRALLLWRADLPAEARRALQPLAGRIDERAMIDLNARARIERVPEARVAADFLRDRLGLAGARDDDSRAARIWLRTREHLALVFLSLVASILAGVPLGILAARRRRLGALVLGASGIVQIIPSLALLVMLVPLLGIGARPAIAALFLYGLLPIVRGAHAGLTTLPPDLLEAATALGLPGGARLVRVELPLASRVLLAGIQTSAVINVGTATLGALVGAGGYGQPILAGVRLADTSLLLEGALPAAVLAIAVQLVFEGLTWLVVPEGLRLPTKT